MPDLLLHVNSWGPIGGFVAAAFFGWFFLVNQGMVSFGKPRDCNCGQEKPSAPAVRKRQIPYNLAKPEPPAERLLPPGRRPRGTR